MLTNLIRSAGYGLDISDQSSFLGASEFNQAGYFEEIRLTLLNDQLFRILYGDAYSFLHMPSPEDINTTFSMPARIPDGFNYDINEQTLYIPDGFEEDVKKFTGNDWDNWGLTRMRPGGKWYQCYERYQCKTGNQIRRLLNTYSDLFNGNDNLVVKDPRMAPVLHAYNIKNKRIILLRRNLDSVLDSMKRHYGPRLFTDDVMPGTSICSNHFNYKIKAQGFDSYVSSYETSFQMSLAGSEYIEVDYDDIVGFGESFRLVEEFIGGRIDKSIIRKN